MKKTLASLAREFERAQKDQHQKEQAYNRCNCGGPCRHWLTSLKADARLRRIRTALIKKLLKLEPRFSLFVSSNGK